MNNLENLVRANIRSLLPYSSARDEFSGTEGVFLDANENPFGSLNRYPDPYQRKLKEKLSILKNIASEHIFIGNGSDEVIDLAFRIFCNPGKDKALTFTPTYGMYEVSAAINDIELIKVSLDRDFQIDVAKAMPFLKDPLLKLIFICSPNNPTGNTLKAEAIETLLKQFKGLVIIDEAYIDFADTPSLIDSIEKFPNLMVSQTFSKAFGLAAARVGVGYASEAIIQLFNKVKPPYNVSELNQQAAIEALNNSEAFKTNLKTLQKEKIRMIQELETLEMVKKIYPSDANFILTEVSEAEKIYKTLVDQKIITRNRNKQISNCIRITIGSPSENKILLQALKNIQL